MSFPRLTARLFLGMALLGVATTPGFAAGRKDKYEEAGRLVDNRRYAEAIAVYQELLSSGEQLDDKLRSRILNNIGFCDFKLKRFKESADFYKRALTIAPSYQTCLNNLAALLMNEKKWNEALPYLLQANAVEKNVKVVFNIFVVHYYLEHQKDALAYVQEAMSLDSAYTEARLKAKDISQADIDKLKKMKPIR